MKVSAQTPTGPGVAELVAAVVVPVSGAFVAGYASGKASGPANELVSRVIDSPSAAVAGGVMGGLVGTVTNQVPAGVAIGAAGVPFLKATVGSKAAATVLATGPTALVHSWVTIEGASKAARALLPDTESESIVKPAAMIAYWAGLLLALRH